MTEITFVGSICYLQFVSLSMSVTACPLCHCLWGWWLLKLQSSQQKVTGICVRRGKWTVSAQHAAPALLCFQLCNRNIITWLLLAAGWDSSLSPPKSSSACRLLSACLRVRSEDEGEFPRDSHKRPEGVWDTQRSLHSTPETISLRATCPHPAFLQAVKRTRCFNQTQKASCSFTGEPKGFMYRSKLNTIQVTH